MEQTLGFESTPCSNGLGWQSALSAWQGKQLMWLYRSIFRLGGGNQSLTGAWTYVFPDPLTCHSPAKTGAHLWNMVCLSATAG